LIGDFNAFPNSSVCKKIKAKFRDVQEDLLNHNPKATWGGHFAVSRIDHIFIEGGIEVKNVKVASAHIDRIASDHLPLIADLKFI
jgi:endonuclease/exonuclease/phosphatase family metal-dependent hydrolase